MNTANPGATPYYAWLNYAMNNWGWMPFGGDQASSPMQRKDRPYFHPRDNQYVEYYTPAGVPVSFVDDPSGTLLTWEHHYRSVACGRFYSDVFKFQYGPNPTGYNHWQGVHNGGFNFIACDGHARWYKNTQLRLEMFTYWKERDTP